MTDSELAEVYLSKHIYPWETKKMAASKYLFEQMLNSGQLIYSHTTKDGRAVYEEKRNEKC